MLNSLFAERFKHIREKSGYTQAEMAEKLGVSRSALSLFEIGKRQPDLQVLKQFIEITECSPRYLLGLQDIEKDENTDICTRTCLTSNTVDALSHRNLAFERAKSDSEKFEASEEIDYIKACEKYSVPKWILNDSEFDDYLICRKLERIIKNSVYEYQTGNYVINSFLQDNLFLSTLSKSAYMATRAIVDIIYCKTHSYDDFEISTDQSEINLAAALYSSGQAFANFFSDLCHDAELVAALHDLDEEDLIFAVENKILKYKDD